MSESYKVPKAYYREGDTLHSIRDDKPFKRIVAEVEGGFLTIYHSNYEFALGTSVEFVSENTVGSRANKKPTKL